MTKRIYIRKNDYIFSIIFLNCNALFADDAPIYGSHCFSSFPEDLQNTSIQHLLPSYEKNCFHRNDVLRCQKSQKSEGTKSEEYSGRSFLTNPKCYTTNLSLLI